MIKELPRYRQQALDRLVAQYPNTTLDYWESAWAKNHRYFIDPDTQVLYHLDTTLNVDAFLTPLSQHSAEYDLHGLRSGHIIDKSATIICQCGNKSLFISYGDYEVLAMCPLCGKSDSIY